jgi:hypothetical protein
MITPGHTTASRMSSNIFTRYLDQLKLNSDTRLRYNRLLGDWWYGTLIDLPYGCMIHSDPNTVKYVFDHDKVYVLDFESSWEHPNLVHDLGIVAAELKHYLRCIKEMIRGPNPISAISSGTTAEAWKSSEGRPRLCPSSSA